MLLPWALLEFSAAGSSPVAAAVIVLSGAESCRRYALNLVARVNEDPRGLPLVVLPKEVSSLCAGFAGYANSHDLVLVDQQGKTFPDNHRNLETSSLSNCSDLQRAKVFTLMSQDRPEYGTSDVVLNCVANMIDLCKEMDVDDSESSSSQPLFVVD